MNNVIQKLNDCVLRDQMISVCYDSLVCDLLSSTK